ncbi:hypothetical protein [Nocardiopsis gilva]|uniref:hypothetical protein n=1 Tax=Nocardiopsis gilva TaxID=280236 RepID=UPI0012682137|nr:hypothetical protein [Nocardiopsis gilva]
MLNRHTLHHFTVDLPKDETLTVVEDLHFLLNGVFTGETLLVRCDGTRHPTVRPLHPSPARADDRTEPPRPKASLSAFPAASDSGDVAPRHVITDLKTAVPEVSGLHPTTVVTLAANGGDTAVTVTVPDDERLLMGLGPVIETAVRAVARLPRPRVHDAERREAAIREALTGPPPPEPPRNLSPRTSSPDSNGWRTRTPPVPPCGRATRS